MRITAERTIVDHDPCCFAGEHEDWLPDGAGSQLGKEEL